MLLRRLNVRTRLIAVIAVPLVLLFAVAGPEVLQRRDDAAAAERAARLSVDAQRVATAVDALQSERTLSAALRAGAADQVGEALDAQRTVTDAAVEDATAALEALAGDAELSATAVTAANQLDDLSQVRQDTDAADSIVPWIDPFEPILAALLDVQDNLGTSVTDAGVGPELGVFALVSRAKEATASQAAQLAAASAWGELRGDQAGILQGFREDERAFRTAYLAASPSALRNDRRAELAAGAGTGSARIVDAVLDGRSLAAVGGLSVWLERSDERRIVFRSSEEARLAEAVAIAEELGDEARQTSNVYLALAGVGFVVALGLCLMAARSITRPLRELTIAADYLAEERLPQLVDALRHPVDDDENYLAAALEPIDVTSEDELGHLARAFNAVQSVAVDVAAEQAALLRKGISDLYVNLARRNQALIDRQIQLLDRLEVEEQDAEVLEHLYLLDHLATRMRRNAESLLILAGAESGPVRAKPIEVVDVVRAALSEVEEYERVDLGAMAPAVLHGPAVSDVAHLIAELLENATHFSPPETAVRVDGSRTGGSYQLVITDQGVGIRPEQLDELNAVLRDPPVTGLALGRSLGCLVAARLAVRHGITVRLRAGERVGVTAYVVIPRHLLVEPGVDPMPVDARPRAVEAAAAPAPAPVVNDPWLDDWQQHETDTEELVPATPVAETIRVEERPAGVPARLSDALPRRAEFDAGLKALLERDEPAGLVERPVGDPAVAPVPTPAPPIAPAAAPAPEPAPGLQRRVPGATADAIPAPAADPPVRRSPDEVRALLSRYRSGLQAGRASDGPEEERS